MSSHPLAPVNCSLRDSRERLIRAASPGPCAGTGRCRSPRARRRVVKCSRNTGRWTQRHSTQVTARQMASSAAAAHRPGTGRRRRRCPQGRGCWWPGSVRSPGRPGPRAPARSRRRRGGRCRGARCGCRRRRSWPALTGWTKVVRPSFCSGRRREPEAISNCRFPPAASSSAKDSSRGWPEPRVTRRGCRASALPRWESRFNGTFSPRAASSLPLAGSTAARPRHLPWEWESLRSAESGEWAAPRPSRAVASRRWWELWSSEELSDPAASAAMSCWDSTTACETVLSLERPTVMAVIPGTASSSTVIAAMGGRTPPRWGMSARYRRTRFGCGSAGKAAGIGDQPSSAFLTP